MTFEILFWHSNLVGKSYFDIRNPILTFELSRKIVFWYSKSYFDIQTAPENAILIFKILFWHSKWVGKSNFDIKILFWHSNGVWKCNFDIRNPILTFKLSRKIVFWHFKSYFDIRSESENVIFWQSKSYFDFRTESEKAIFIFNILFWHSNWDGQS